MPQRRVEGAAADHRQGDALPVLQLEGGRLRFLLRRMPANPSASTVATRKPRSRARRSSWSSPSTTRFEASISSRRRRAGC